MNLLKTLAAISSMTMVSRVTGLLRESLMMTFLGRSIYTDAFLVAFRLPNLLRRLFAEGAFSQAFVPLLSEYKNKNGDGETKELVDQAATALVWSTMLISIVGILAAPLLIYWIVDPKEQTPDSWEDRTNNDNNASTPASASASPPSAAAPAVVSTEPLWRFLPNTRYDAGCLLRWILEDGQGVGAALMRCEEAPAIALE